MQFLFRPRFYRANFDLRDFPQAAEAMAVLKSWSDISKLPEAKHDEPVPDFEDFHENAIRYHYAKQSGLGVHVLDRSKGCSDAYDPATWRFLGSSVREDGYDGNAATHYHLLKSFRALAGRRIELVNFTDKEDPKNPENVIHSLRTDGYEHLIGKVMTQAKYTNNTYHCEENDHDTDVAMALFDWAPCHFEGSLNAGMIQEFIDMQYEYRFIFVDGKIVTGAGCIEEFTPYNRLDTDAAFDPQLRQHRHQKSEVVVDHEKTNLMVSFAQDALAQMVQEQPALSEGTIDVALNKKGEPLVIELNGAPQYGLYACNAKLIIDAHSAAIQKAIL